MLIVAAVIAFLLLGFATDRIVGHVAESRLSERIDCGLGSSARTNVSLGGLLKSPSLLSGTLGQVTLSAHDVSVSGITADLTVDLTDVQMSRTGSGNSITTGSGSATAVVGFDGVSQAIAAGNGMSFKIGAYGDSLAISPAEPKQRIAGQAVVLMRVGIDATSIVLTPTGVMMGSSQIPIDLARTLLSARNPRMAQNLEERRLPLKNLPGNVQLTSATVAAEGLTLQARITPGTVQLAERPSAETSDCAAADRANR